MNRDSQILVTGHRGMVGSAIVRELKRKGYGHVINGGSADYRNAVDTSDTFSGLSVEYVFHCAAHAGGINEAITKPAEMLTDNILINTHVIDACHKHKVKKLINLGSSCIYPIDAPQPYKEESVGCGKTDENWSYAVAKIAAVELCRAYHKQYGDNFITLMPCNMYGPNDKFDFKNAHVIPSLIKRFHDSNGGPIEIWGDGSALREFLYVDDFAEAAVMLMEDYDYEDMVDGVLNVGSGVNTPIRSLVDTINSVVKQSHAEVVYNTDKPNGVHSKLMDSTRIGSFGWHSRTTLNRGISKAYEDFKRGAPNQPGEGGSKE